MAAATLIVIMLAMPQTEVTYELSMPQPSTHLYHVTMTVRGMPGESFEIAWPVWTPGSYKVRDYSQFVQDVEGAEQIDKTTWRVTGDTIRYKVFAHTEVSVRTNWLDTEGATVIGAATFPYIRGRQDARHTVRVTAPEGWTVATAPPTGVHYDLIVDNPLLVGRLQEAAFKVRDVPHRVVVMGPCPADLPKLAADFARIVEAAIDVFGDVPYKDYTFLLRSLPGGGGGGLEHLNSCLMDVTTDRFRTEEGLKGILGLASHEFFHTWNVKRLRPRELGPFDYTKENYTKLLWVMEGVTSYYTDLLLRRAGLITHAESFERGAKLINGLIETPGRLRESPEMASFNAWIHKYMEGPHSVNSTASYYNTGSLLGMALDLEIRRRGDKSLDDVMRTLYREYPDGITPEDFQKACEAAAGASMDEFFAAHVSGTKDPQLTEGLAHVGVELVDEGKPEPYIGLKLDGNKVTAVFEDGPAFRDGICVEDEILAIDGLKVDMAKWADRVTHLKDGAKMRVSLFRRGALKEVDVTVERPKRPKMALKRVATPTAEQEKAFAGWLR